MNCTEAGKLGSIARNKNLSAKRRKEISQLANKAKSLKRGRPKNPPKVYRVGERLAGHTETCVSGEYGCSCKIKNPPLSARPKKS